MPADSCRVSFVRSFVCLSCFLIGVRIGCTANPPSFISGPRLRGSTSLGAAASLEQTIDATVDAASQDINNGRVRPNSPATVQVETGGADPARGRRRLRSVSWLEGVWPQTSPKRALRESEEEEEEENEVDTEFELPFDAFPLMMDHNGQLLGLKEKATKLTPKGRRSFGLPVSFF